MQNCTQGRENADAIEAQVRWLKANETPPYSKGQEVFYRDRIGQTHRSTVVGVDHAFSPASYTIRLPDGGERSTEASRLSDVGDECTEFRNENACTYRNPVMSLKKGTFVPRDRCEWNGGLCKSKPSRASPPRPVERPRSPPIPPRPTVPPSPTTHAPSPIAPPIPSVLRHPKETFSEPSAKKSPRSVGVMGLWDRLTRPSDRPRISSQIGQARDNAASYASQIGSATALHAIQAASKADNLAKRSTKMGYRGYEHYRALENRKLRALGETVSDPLKMKTYNEKYRENKQQREEDNEREKKRLAEEAVVNRNRRASDDQDWQRKRMQGYLEKRSNDLDAKAEDSGKHLRSTQEMLFARKDTLSCAAFGGDNTKQQLCRAILAYATPPARMMR